MGSFTYGKQMTDPFFCCQGDGTSFLSLRVLKSDTLGRLQEQKQLNVMHLFQASKGANKVK